MKLTADEAAELLQTLVMHYQIHEDTNVQDFMRLVDIFKSRAERAEEELCACQSALKSMVNQYLYRPLDLKTKEPCEDVYQHDFMSAGEEACDYLVRYGLAVWTDGDKYAIKFIQKETE